MRVRGLALFGVVALVAAFAGGGYAAAGNTAGASTATAGGPFPKVDQPGVSDTEIDVGGVASITNNPVGSTFGDSFAGTQAYFKKINSEGGIYGRKLKLTSKRDDQLSNNQLEVQGLISEDDVFAALPVTVVLFTGAHLLEQEGIPTFGWNINPEWGSEDRAGAPNMFGEKRSYLCFTCGPAHGQQVPWLAKQIGAKQVAVLSYTVEQSTNCLKGVQSSFKRYPTAKIALTDSSLPFGTTDFSNEVSQMIDKKVGLVIGCMDNNGLLNLAREMKKQGLDAVQWLPQSYDQEFIEANAQFFEGSYVVTFFTPLELKQKPPGLQQYLKWMKKTESPTNEHSLSGWINADLFVTGLKAAGPEFTREKVVDAINQLTDYTAGGLLPGIDWTTQHTANPVLDCQILSKIHDGKFVPSFGAPGKPFGCFEENAAKLPAKPVNR